MSASKECEFCSGRTKTGGTCKRRAQCKSGCEYFCWQHAEVYGGVYLAKDRLVRKSASCVEPTIDNCSACEPGNTYPCKIGYHGMFFDEAEMKEYCDMVGETQYDVEEMRKLAKKRTEEWRAELKSSSKSKKRKSSSRSKKRKSPQRKPQSSLSKKSPKTKRTKSPQKPQRRVHFG